MSSEGTGASSSRRGRSPSYPAIDLRAAVARAEALYKVEKMHPAPMKTIVGHWGYSNPRSGSAAVQYASLKKFGLLTEEGSGDGRMGKLTPLAYSILHNPDETQRASALREAALTPTIHRELWGEFGDELPSDANLQYRLVTERGFTEPGAHDFVKQYRATLAFAPLTATGMPPITDVGPEDDTHHADSSESEKSTDHLALPSKSIPAADSAAVTPVVMPATTPGVTRHSIPLVGGAHVVIEGEFPISHAAWEGLMTVLEAFKPGLVESTEP